jgi:hypothetical protein
VKEISELTDQEINLNIAESSGEYSEGYFDKNPKNVPDFIGDWNLLMPLAINHGINFFQSTMLGIRTGNMYASDIHQTFEVMKCENPQRALAECLLSVLQIPVSKDEDIEDSTFRLFMCDQETGKEGMLDCGTEQEMKSCLKQENNNGADVWIITPSGNKILPAEIQ